MRECVQETIPNGRRFAVMELREVLENYLNINDSAGRNSNENIAPHFDEKNTKH